MQREHCKDERIPAILPLAVRHPAGGSGSHEPEYQVPSRRIPGVSHFIVGCEHKQNFWLGHVWDGVVNDFLEDSVLEPVWMSEKERNTSEMMKMMLRVTKEKINFNRMK